MRQLGADTGGGEGAVAIECLADEGFELLGIVLKIEPAAGPIFAPKRHIKDVPTLLVNDQAVDRPSLGFERG